MAHKKKVETSALNVRTHPHDAETYKRLFQQAYSLRRSMKIHGDRHGMITALQRIGRDDEIVRGTITTFVELDLDGSWLNTDTLEEASDNEVQRVVIPENLRTNLSSFYFAFLVPQHEIVFEHYGSGNRLTHFSALNFFKNLFNQPEIAAEFGDVKVTIVQSKGSIDRLFSIPRITELEVYIEKPNGDIWDDGFEENADVKYQAERGESLRRDDDLDALLRASIRNGRAVAKGYGEDGHMIVSTDRYPRVEQTKYDPDETSESQAFESTLQRFMRRRGR